MKIYKIISLAFLSLAFVACENTDVQMPAMSYVANKAIVADTLKCSKGDTITFTPVGNADYVSFWSGEASTNYYGLKETTVTNAKINFVSGLYKDITAKYKKFEYKVYLSTDYTANHQLTGTAIISINAATWRDITPLFADNSTTSTTAGVASGDLDVTEYAKKPFYIAFKYKNDTTAIGPTLYLKSFTVNDSTKELGLIPNFISPVTQLVTGVGNKSWYSCLVSGDLIYAKKWAVSGTQVQVTGQATYKNETWLVSPLINLSRGTADMGVAIKDVNGLPRPYLYVYKNAGIYKAVFVYTNSYLGVSKQVKQDFTIQVK
jgi:Domain of unknown function (DUF5017)